MSNTRDFSRRSFLHTLTVAVGASISGCSGLRQTSTESPARAPTIDVPTKTHIAEPLPVTVSDLDSKAAIELLVQPTDPSLESYRWRQGYTADDAGQIEVFAGETGESEQPRMVLSALTEKKSENSDPFALQGDGAVDLQIQARTGGSVVAEETTTRIARASGTRGQTVQADDLAGTVYRPDGDGPYRPVLVLHGSAGEVPEEFCQMLATQGYWTLGLQYFGSGDSIPDTLANVPMEYFERAVTWAQSQSVTTDDRVGFVGFSRGVEPALMTAASMDINTTVVGYSGSVTISPAYETKEIPWTRNGSPVVSMKEVDAFSRIIDNADCDPGLECSFEKPQKPCRGIACPVNHVRATNREVYDAVMIPVEDIEGPITLLTGRADTVWNASVFSETALVRLVRSNHEYSFSHHAYSDAGHIFLRPYYPNLLRGGSRQGNTRAAVQSWLRTLDTLASN